MADNVVTLGNKPVYLPEEPVPEVVLQLESLLDRARKGEIRCIAFAVATNEDFGAGWTTEGTEKATLKAKILAAASLLSFRMNAQIAENGLVPAPDH